MKTLLVILLVLNCTVCNLFGQSDKSSNYPLAERIFKSEYKKESFERYKGKIEIINESTFKFGGKTLLIFNTDQPLIEIFKTGIFNADIVFGKDTSKPLTKKQIDTLSISQKVFHNMLRNDSLSINTVKELTELNPNYQTKRFGFWLFSPGRLNPTEYYFEIYNKKATKKSTLTEFLENATMTFFYKGTIII